MAQFALSLHPEKTRLIEFGKFAAERRKRRGEGKPETFDFLGFTHYCTTRKDGTGFQLGRRTQRKRMRAKLHEITETLRRDRHEPIDEQGRWLGAVMRGYFAYFAVPTNSRMLSAFRCPHRRTVVPQSAATQSAASDDVGADEPAHRPVPAARARAAPVAGSAVSRHITQGRSRVPELGTLGSVRGAASNGRPYRDKA